MRKNLLGRIRKGEPFTFGELLLLTWQLSVPAIMAKITTVMMQYIDASMVGMIGAGAAASIGLVGMRTESLSAMKRLSIFHLLFLASGPLLSPVNCGVGSWFWNIPS